MYLVVGLLAFWVIAVVLMLFYQVFGFNKVRCATCGEKLRERDSIEHGGDPTAYTHPGICTDRQSKIHADTYYANNI